MSFRIARNSELQAINRHSGSKDFHHSATIHSLERTATEDEKCRIRKWPQQFREVGYVHLFKQGRNNYKITKLQKLPNTPN